MLDHGYGYSHVMTDDGTDGYVSNDDIKPAPPEPAAASAPNPLRVFHSERRNDRGATITKSIHL